LPVSFDQSSRIPNLRQKMVKKEGVPIQKPL